MSTVTGFDDILRRQHFERMKPNAIIANAGHFATEINIGELKDLSSDVYKIRDHVTCFTLADKQLFFGLMAIWSSFPRVMTTPWKSWVWV